MAPTTFGICGWSSKIPTFAADTSAAVAAIDPGSVHHRIALRAALAHRPALAGLAAFETYSVLTRLPSASRLTPSQASSLLATNFPEPCFLGARETTRLLGRLGDLGIVGGAVYDALVAEAAREHGRVLLSLDQRAIRTYQAVGAEFQLIE